MDNQHRSIKGYRDLTQAEIDLMNKIKAHGEAAEQLLGDVYRHVSAQHMAARPSYGEAPDDNPLVDGPCLDSDEQLEAKSAEMARLKHADPFRWHAMAKSSLQLGVMELVRAVAQPSSF